MLGITFRPKRGGNVSEIEEWCHAVLLFVDYSTLDSNVISALEGHASVSGFELNASHFCKLPHMQALSKKIIATSLPLIHVAFDHN